jgi:TPR repeat protein
MSVQALQLHQLAAVHKAVLAAVFLTTLVPVSLAVLNATGIGDRLYHFRSDPDQKYLDRVYEIYFDPQSVEYSGNVPDRIAHYIRTNHPKAIAKFITLAQNPKFESELKKYSVEIAETSGVRYAFPTLIFLAASDLMAGKTGALDFPRAFKLLQLDFLTKDKRHELYLGLWWSDSKNPGRNIDKAKVHLQRAADAGIIAARNKLAQINK